MKDRLKKDSAERKARRLRAMDDEWLEKRKQYAIATSGESKEIYPTDKAIAIFLVIGMLALALFYYIIRQSGLTGWLILIPLVLIANLTYTFFAKKKLFEKEYAEHILRRNAVEHEEIYNPNKT